MGRVFQDGDRVRQRGATSRLGYGVVLGPVDGSSARVRFDAGGGSDPGGMDYPVSDLELEVPADAPAVGAPGDAFRAAVREELDLATRQMDERNQRAIMYGLGGYANQMQEAPRAQSQMVDSARAQVDVPGPHTSPEDVIALREALERLRETCSSQSNLLTGLRSDLADAKGSLDKARSRVVELEGNEAWLRREVVRLGGKARGCK